MSTQPAPPPTPLCVRTVRIEEPVDLLRHLPAEPSGAWLHRGEGLVGVGVAARITAREPDRFSQAARRFSDLAASARVEDDVQGRGTGLIALGSFGYAAASARESVLVVPQALLGVVDGEAFLTLASTDGAPRVPASWRDLFAGTPVDVPGSIELEPAHTPDEYQGLVATAIARIRAGEAGKVVLSETTDAALDSPLVPGVVLRRLAERFPSTWVYAVDDVIGASPEMLAQTEHGRVFSRVLAGTRPVDEHGALPDDERLAFRTDAKELAEHAFAVESVTSRLDGLATGITTSPEPFVLRLPGLEHLASDISGDLRAGVTSLDVAGALHPSAAVCGTPREAADRMITELEGRDRGGYAAPVGWLDASGDGQWAIALRMVHRIDPRTVRLQAGGGLVAASDPVTEHAEVLAKMRPMVGALRGGGPPLEEHASEGRGSGDAAPEG